MVFTQLNVLAQTKVDVVDWIDPYFIEEERERSQVVDRRCAICRTSRKRAAGRRSPNR